MAIILLAGPQSERKEVIYTLNTETGEVIKSELNKNNVQGQRVAGVGDFLEIGCLFNKRQVFVGSYADEMSLYLWVDKQSFDLLNNNIEVRRRAHFIPKTEIQILRDGATVWKAYYRYHMKGEFPPEDIFEYFPGNSRKSRVRRFLKYKDRLHGVDTSDASYRKELEAKADAWLENEYRKQKSSEI